MTHENIERLIDALNAKEMLNCIFLAALSDRVDRAKVWLEEPRGKACSESSYDFFFIKDENDIYVAAVLDMVNDLHVFVKEAQRKKGHLSNAMKSVVLPKLHQDGRKSQTITFENPEVRDYCIRNWGFRMTSNSSAELDLSIFSGCPQISPIGSNLSHEDFSEMKVRINRAKLYLRMTKEQLETAYGECEELYLGDLMSTISDIDDEILNFIESKQGILRPSISNI